ncbi:MAG: protein TolR [Rhizobiaceae bacterium]
MGMSVGNGGVSGGRRRGSGRHKPMSEINVTPFVDVMLVLLIIFMVAAPLLTVGVPIDLPETRANQLNSETQPITISVREGGQVFLQETEIEPDELIAKLKAIAKNGYDERLYVRGDRATDYGTVMRIMGALNEAGYRKIGLVTLQEQDG